MKRRLIALLGAATLLSTTVHAGAGHEHGPKHGGVVREVKSVTYELVGKANSLTVTLAGQPEAKANFNLK